MSFTTNKIAFKSIQFHKQKTQTRISPQFRQIDDRKREEDDGLPCQATKFDSSSPQFRLEFAVNTDYWKLIATVSVR